jgi:pyridoxine 5-phosphate synthase
VPFRLVPRAQVQDAAAADDDPGRLVGEPDRGLDHAAAGEELNRLREAAAYGYAKGIEIHVGHGLTYDTVRPVAAIPEVRELNIGHFIMGEALFVGLDTAVRRMRDEIDLARGNA